MEAGDDPNFKSKIFSKKELTTTEVMATSCGAETMGKCVIGHGPLKLWTCREGLEGGKKGLGRGLCHVTDR